MDVNGVVLQEKKKAAVKCVFCFVQSYKGRSESIFSHLYFYTQRIYQSETKHKMYLRLHTLFLYLTFPRSPPTLSIQRRQR